jgi:hypothetical protein
MAGLIDIGSAVALPVTKIVGDVLNRLLPAEKMSEFERAKIALDVQTAIQGHDWREAESVFKDRADARALAAKDIDKGNAFSGFLAATVRPIWGFSALIVVAYPYLAGSLDWPAVMLDDATKDIVQTVIMFYFGGRTVEKVMTVVKGAKG